MAIAFRAASAVDTQGNAGTAALSTAPALPTGTVSGDRVYVCTVGTTTANSVNTNWNRILSASLGTGTLGSGTGQRILTVDYRDYDGAWTMPTFGQASQSAPTMLGIAISYSLDVGGAWNTPTSTSGSDTSALSTTFSVTGAANLSATTGDLLVVLAGLPGNGTSAMTVTSPTMTATGATLGTITARANAGFATGDNATLVLLDALVSSGTETSAPTTTATVGSGHSSGGAIFVRQTFGAAAPPSVNPRQLATRVAVLRAANF